MSKQISKRFKILAIETSCDETSAALLQVTCLDGRRASNKKPFEDTQGRQVTNIEILSNIVSSQVKLHSKYGGVYPELASREHVKNIIPVIIETLKQGNKLTKNQNDLMLKCFNVKLLDCIDYIAVTTGPGLIGSLLVGTETAKTLAYVYKKPIVAVNHLEGHIYANFIGINPKSEAQNSKQIPDTKYQIPDTNPKFPILALIVSGGHTSLIYMKDHLSYKIIGETLDDAAGEAYDKVANMLGLGYPGGPVIDAEASKFKLQVTCLAGRRASYKLQNNLFPRPLINKNNFDFSFSGLKTSVLYYLKKQKHSRRFANNKPVEDPRQNKILSGHYSKNLIGRVCYEFQEAVVETLVAKTLRAAKRYCVKSVIISGGVAANSRLRDAFSSHFSQPTSHVKLYLPEKKLCTDNAAMIGAAAAYKVLAGKPTSCYDIKADANLELGK